MELQDNFLGLAGMNEISNNQCNMKILFLSYTLKPTSQTNVM